MQDVCFYHPSSVRDATSENVFCHTRADHRALSGGESQLRAKEADFLWLPLSTAHVSRGGLKLDGWSQAAS